MILHSVAGPAKAGDYVSITVLGAAQVKAQAGKAIQPGQRVTVGAERRSARPADAHGRGDGGQRRRSHDRRRPARAKGRPGLGTCEPTMRGNAMKLLRILPAPLLVVVFATVALAQSGGGYDFTWSAVAGGGGTSGGGNYKVQGAIGQHDVGGPQPQGNKFQVEAGFGAPPLEPPSPPAQSKIYLPLVRK